MTELVIVETEGAHCGSRVPTADHAQTTCFGESLGDGALVGGASLDVEGFSAIVRYQKHVGV